MTDIWTPHLTVAAVIEQEGKFLLVEERSEGKIVLNQPAGHVEENETLVEAVIRETLEESGRPFKPEAVSGIYRWRSPNNGITYLRLAFCGSHGKRDRDLALDTDIITTHWLSLDELQQRDAQLRSPLVMRCIEDYLAGQRYPLELVEEIR
jgi:8-oxo-dGTP pyrophosphatase MutT (NUDIX family)